MSQAAKRPEDDAEPTSGEETTSSKPQSPKPETRESGRFSVDLEVTMSSDHNFYAGFAENISSGGLFVATYVRRRKGDRLEIVFNIPSHPEPIRATGEVRWVREYSEHSNVPPGFGVRFVDLPDDAALAIDRFLKDREPLFYDDD